MNPFSQSLREIDGDLINHWYILCLSHEISANKPIQRVLYEQAYVIYRDSRGQAVVMLDRCPHRGVRLSEGSCQAGHLVCPYHGWKFGEKGQLKHVPSDGPESTPVSGWGGEVIPSHEQDGVLWVWPGNPKEQSSHPSWRFPEYQTKGWQNYFMITDFNNEVTFLAENFMDVPHTVFVHNKWFRSSRALKVPISLEVGQGRVKVTYQAANDSIGIVKRMLNPKGHKMVHTDEYVFPNITRVDYIFGSEHFIINSQCSPIRRGETRVYTWICYRLPLIGPLLKPLLQFYTRKVITQDVEIMENHGKNLRLFPEWFRGEKYKNTAADELHLAIDRMRLSGIKDRHSVQNMNYRREREFWI
jgi:phenylpropionate dioxygenase-like ring-hydroxylating dioxygenase large terminal subunit